MNEEILAKRNAAIRRFSRRFGFAQFLAKHGMKRIAEPIYQSAERWLDVALALDEEGRPQS